MTRSIGIFNMTTGSLREQREVTGFDLQTIEELKNAMRKNLESPFVVVDSDLSLEQSIKDQDAFRAGPTGS